MTRIALALVPVVAGLSAILLLFASPALAQPSDNVYCGTPVTDVGQELTESGAAAAITTAKDNFYREWLDPLFGDNRSLCGLGLAVIDGAAGSNFVRVLVGRDAFRWIRTAEVIGNLPREKPVPEQLPAVGPSDDMRAPVSWTGGLGLWLNGGPGTRPLHVVSEGTSVTLLCHTRGPAVTGPHGTTTIWNHVRTPSGATGYMSDAYLFTGTNGPAASSC